VRAWGDGGLEAGEVNANVTRTALVTGANRGIGLEVCRQLAAQGLHVVMTARDAALGEAAAATLKGGGAQVRFEPLDVADGAAALDLARRLAGDGVRVDVLVNNAGVYPPGRVLDTPPAVMAEALDVNYWGAFHCCRAFVPGMVAAGYGRVVNVSSGAGSFDDGIPGPAAYGVSKAALNALTLKLALEVPDGVKVNAVCPGWVRTRMGGEGAPRDVARGAEGVVWAATLPADGPSGGFFRDRRSIPW
jgi:NAD(P)-dependent dehydrogenase (short-subunit alcohol dehydrogenase family)